MVQCICEEVLYSEIVGIRNMAHRTTTASVRMVISRDTGKFCILWDSVCTYNGTNVNATRPTSQKKALVSTVGIYTTQQYSSMQKTAS